MKKYIAAVWMVIVGLYGFCQEGKPVKWAFSCKKINASSYEVHLTATIDEGWHTYSQTTPDGGPRPTTIHFAASPLLVVGKPKEVGKLEQHAEPLSSAISEEKKLNFSDYANMCKSIH